MLCLAQYSPRVIPLSAKPAMIFGISCLLRIPPFSAASLSQSRWVPQTLTVHRRYYSRNPRKEVELAMTDSAKAIAFATHCLGWTKVYADHKPPRDTFISDGVGSDR